MKEAMVKSAGDLRQRSEVVHSSWSELREKAIIGERVSRENSRPDHFPETNDNNRPPTKSGPSCASNTAETRIIGLNSKSLAASLFFDGRSPTTFGRLRSTTAFSTRHEKKQVTLFIRALPLVRSSLGVCLLTPRAQIFQGPSFQWTGNGATGPKSRSLYPAHPVPSDKQPYPNGQLLCVLYFIFVWPIADGDIRFARNDDSLPQEHIMCSPFLTTAVPTKKEKKFQHTTKRIMSFKAPFGSRSSYQDKGTRMHKTDTFS